VHGGGGGGGKRKHTTKATASRGPKVPAATRATFSHDALTNPFSSGTFRWVAKGEYEIGERSGEPCVCKWFKSGTTLEEEFFADDIKAVDRALKLIEHFNAAGLVDKVITLNIPEVWTFDSDSSFMGDTKVLQEPFIENYQKFNSNSGWASEFFWGDSKPLLLLLNRGRVVLVGIGPIQPALEVCPAPSCLSAKPHCGSFPRTV
jgi:hypothetical protein